MRHVARAIVAALIAVLLVAAPAEATEEQAAREVAGTLLQESYDAVAAGDPAQVEQAVADAFALDIWERFLLAEHELSEAQRESFRQFLPGYLANLYFQHLGGDLAGAPEITGTRPARGDVLVSATFPRTGGGELPIDYRLRAIEGEGPRVIDIMVGGVSYLLLKRDEFKAIIEAEGVEGLFAHMRENAV